MWIINRMNDQREAEMRTMRWVKSALWAGVVLATSLVMVACGGGGGAAGTGSGGVPAPAAPAAPSLSLVAQGVKDFHFTWTPAPGATEYRLLENPDGVSSYVPVASVAGDASNYDHQVFLPERINASYVLQACNSVGCAESAPVKVAGALSAAVGYFKASNTIDGGYFGTSAALSSDGSTLAVGAYGDCSAAKGINGDESGVSSCRSGAVFVFARNLGVWSKQAYLKASNADQGDAFGESVAISSDGNTLAVGARFEFSKATGVNGDETDNSASASGAVYVFTRSGSTWSQQAYLKASNTGSGDNFGFRLALAGDGNTLAVGAYMESGGNAGINGDQTDNSKPYAGSVYVFTRTSGSWSQQAYVKSSNPDAFDAFGYSLALSGDGNTLAVGALYESSSATGIDGNQTDNSVRSSGAVYVFTRTGTVWTQQAYVKPSIVAVDNNFGTSVALSADGDTMAVGAPRESSNAGAVYVFVRAAGAWAQQAIIKGSNTEVGDAFGMAVALSADGSKLAVGAPYEDGRPAEINEGQSDNTQSNAGAVYVFRRSGGAWAQQAYIKAPNAESGDGFGGAVAFSGDGNTLAVGAQQESSAATGIGGDQSDNNMAESGALYLY